jgi:hypothetical protein
MAEQFNKKSLKAAYLTSDNASERNSILQGFKSREFNYLFVVDIFNEGVDIPEIDTLLFLRPTESLTIFLQQLGRGLRLHEDKSCLTVLDFVGQQHAEYSFEHKFRGMLGKTHTRIKEEIENDFPHLPLGCSITLERTAKEIILKNITRAYRGGLQTLVNAIVRFKSEYTLSASLENFCSMTEIGLHKIYATKFMWHQLQQRANGSTTEPNELEKRIAQVLGSTWLSTESTSYFEFIRRFITDKSCDTSNLENQQYLMILYIDLFDSAPEVESFDQLLLALAPITSNTDIRAEIVEYLDYRIKQLTAVEKAYSGNLTSVLRLHGRYTRNQILAGLSESTLNRKASSREGSFKIARANAELLFVTLDKSEGSFKPSTMYHDYFISEELFHWQSQNSTSETSSVGQSYINQTSLKKEILLFVREATRDENGNTMAFVFCGPLHYIKHEGNKPMSVMWRMTVAPPAELLNEGKKMAVG